jgi:hypothetical protein
MGPVRETVTTGSIGSWSRLKRADFKRRWTQCAGSGKALSPRVERARAIRILELDPLIGRHSNDAVDLPTPLVVWTRR